MLRMARRQHGQIGSKGTRAVASSRRMVRMELLVWRSGRTGRAARDEVLRRGGRRRSLLREADRGVFFDSADEAGTHQKSVSSNRETGVMMKAAPVAPS